MIQRLGARSLSSMMLKKKGSLQIEQLINSNEFNNDE